MTDLVQGVIVGDAQMTPDEARAWVAEPMRAAQGAVIETGRRLIELKAGRLHGEWLPFLESLDWGIRTSQEWMKIAAHPVLGNAQHVAHLPADWGALGRLASLEGPKIEELIASGDITPALSRDDVGKVINKARGITPDMADSWYTPPWLFEQLGLRFDLDVCAPADPAHRTCPANRYYTETDDGLTAPWHGLVWCNPPYSGAGAWIDRMAEHGNGIALTHMPFNALWMVRAVRAASSARLAQTVEFLRPNGDVERPGYGLILLTFGGHLTEALDALDHDYMGPTWLPR